MDSQEKLPSLWSLERTRNVGEKEEGLLGVGVGVGGPAGASTCRHAQWEYEAKGQGERSFLQML